MSGKTESAYLFSIFTKFAQDGIIQIFSAKMIRQSAGKSVKFHVTGNVDYHYKAIITETGVHISTISPQRELVLVIDTQDILAALKALYKCLKKLVSSPDSMDDNMHKS